MYRDSGGMFGACVAALALALALAGAERVGGWSRFAVETTVLLAEAGGGAGDARGYTVRGQLTMHAPRATDADDDDDTTLLEFRLEGMQASWMETPGGEGGGEVAGGGPWGATVHAARARRGRVLHVLHDPALPPRHLDHARALLSLFQFDVAGGERNETDVSGECAVLYETVTPHTFRKVKRSCEHDEGVGAGARVQVRRVARYTLADEGHLAAVLADEVVTARLALADLAVKARSLHTVTLLEHRPAAPAGAPPTAPPPHYVEAPLAMPVLEPPDPDDTLTVDAAVVEFGAALAGAEAGGGGDVAGAEALARLVPVLRAAPADALAATLRGERGAGAQLALCGALGLAGTGAAAAALRRADTPPAHYRAYLAGLGVARAPHPAAVEDALALALAASTPPPLADAALLAAAAAARAADHPALVARLRDTLTRSLARCKEEGCRRVRVAALGNLRAGDTGDAVVAGAAAGAGGRLEPRQLGALAALAGNASRALDDRAAALDLLAVAEARAGGGALPLRTADAWRALHAERGAAAGELRRLLEQRVRALAAAGREPARRLLAALPPQLRGWDAPPGHSTLLVRDAGWTGPGSAWRAELTSRQVTLGGLLRRGRVSLAAASPHAEHELLAVELWTRGLGALAGATADAADAEEEPVAAGLRLAVAGVALPDLDLFEGQGELVGHIWAGTGSTDTAVLRGAWAADAARGALPLAGGVALGVRGGGALAVALDARAAVSLWQRAARGALAVRGAAAARLRLAAGPLRLEARAAAAPRLRIHADLDFYEGVALCVRAATAPHDEVHEARVQAGERGGERVRRRTVARPPRTLSLGRENDAACRTLRSADDD